MLANIKIIAVADNHQYITFDSLSDVEKKQFLSKLLYNHNNQIISYQ